MDTATPQNIFNSAAPDFEIRNGSSVSALSEASIIIGKAPSDLIAKVDTNIVVISLVGVLSILISGIINLLLLIL